MLCVKADSEKVRQRETDRVAGHIHLSTRHHHRYYHHHLLAPSGALKAIPTY